DAANHDDAVDRVRSRHERRVQHDRYLGDHLEPHEHREHEHVDLGQQREAHAGTCAGREGAGTGPLCPSCATHVAARMSSAKFRFSAPSLTMSWTSASRLRAYIWLACTASWAGRFTGPRIVTPWATISWPGFVSSQLPPVSAARSTITAPCLMSRTIASVTSTGALRPGTLAVVTTTSETATCLWITSRSRASCSPVSALA